MKGEGGAGTQAKRTILLNAPKRTQCSFIDFSLTTSGSTEIQDEFRSERINTIKYVLTIPEMVRRMTNFHSKYLHKFTNVYFGNKSDSRAAEPRGELAWASTLLVGSGCCGGCTSHSNIFNWLTISFLFFRCSFVFSFFRSIVPSVSFSPAFFYKTCLSRDPKNSSEDYKI